MAPTVLDFCFLLFLCVCLSLPIVVTPGFECMSFDFDMSDSDESTAADDQVRKISEIEISESECEHEEITANEERNHQKASSESGRDCDVPSVENSVLKLYLNGGSKKGDISFFLSITLASNHARFSVCMCVCVCFFFQAFKN